MAEVIRYVNPDSSGGDGTTSALSGTNAAYASLSAWNAAEATDLVSAGDFHRVICASGGSADTTAFNVSGWTTGASNYISIEGDANTGVWDTGAYRREITTANDMGVQEDYVRISGIQFQISPTIGGRACLSFNSHSTTCDLRVSKCIFRGGSGATQAVTGVQLSVANANGYRIENCLFYDMDNAGSVAINTGQAYGSRATKTVEHCTIINCLVGVEVGTNTTCVNVGYDSQGLGSADGFDTSGGGGAAGSLNCFSDLTTDATSLSGSGHGDSTNPTFSDEAGDDFTLASGDTAWKDAGGTAVNVTDDIVGTTRTGTFDVGFFEVVAASGTTLGGLVGFNTGLIG